MQLEHILQAHGLIGKGGGGKAIPLPEVVNFTATSKDDGTGINLTWQNSSIGEYVKTKIFVSMENIQNANYDYCIANATEIINDTSTSFTYTNVIRGTTYYFKAFMVFEVLGEVEQNKGVGLSCLVTDVVPPGTITSFQVVQEDNELIELSWKNPVDTDFNKVKIIYKTGGYPTSLSDGMLVYEGSGISKIITGLTNDVEYYFRAFTFDNTGNINSITTNQQIVGTPSDGDDKTGSPGNKNLIAGDMTAGYFGVVPTSELFTGTELALACGITQGTAQFNDVGWLKFAIDGAIIFKSQKTYRHSISWDHIHTVGCVLGTKQVTKSGHTYKVRLMRGALTNPSLYDATDRGAKGSEWNRLMLPIHVQAKDKSWAYPAYVESTIPYWGINFTDVDLHTIDSAGNGSYHWCQETSNTDATRRVIRGYHDVSYSGYLASSNTTTFRGWSPVLEWVS